jgi:Fe-S cluster biogenesis protein NfuA
MRIVNNEVEQQARELITKIRPFIQRDGGDMRYVEIKDNILYIELLGACIGCAASTITLKQGIETIVLEEIPGILAVEAI